MKPETLCERQVREGAARTKPGHGGSRLFGAVFDSLAAQRRASLAGMAACDIERLKDLGVRVANGEARLDEDVELLRPSLVRQALCRDASDWLADLAIHSHLPSTHIALLEEAQDGAVAGRVIAAEVQTSGKGRRGRKWHSPFGRNLALSLGFALPRPAAEVGAFSLVVGLAVRAALADVGLRDADLKWPNDVLLEGRKLAGVLIEIVGRQCREVAVGIGVNIGCAAALTPRVEQPIADVAERVPHSVRNLLAAALINRMVDATAAFAANGFAVFKAEWERAHRHQNKIVTITLAGSGETVTGVARGVDGDGSLRIVTEAGVRSFVSGEVSVRQVIDTP